MLNHCPAPDIEPKVNAPVVASISITTFKASAGSEPKVLPPALVNQAATLALKIAVVIVCGKAGGKAGFLKRPEWDRFHGPDIEANWKKKNAGRAARGTAPARGAP